MAILRFITIEDYRSIKATLTQFNLPLHSQVSDNCFSAVHQNNDPIQANLHDFLSNLWPYVQSRNEASKYLPRFLHCTCTALANFELTALQESKNCICVGLSAMR